MERSMGRVILAPILEIRSSAARKRDYAMAANGLHFLRDVSEFPGIFGPGTHT
jgi:hypothetical protein